MPSIIISICPIDGVVPDGKIVVKNKSGSVVGEQAIKKGLVIFSDLSLGEYGVESTAPVVSWEVNPKTVKLDTDTPKSAPDIVNGYVCISFYYETVPS